VRHGRPNARHTCRLRANEFPAWLRAYDEAGIDPLLPPPEALKAALATCKLLLTSPAKRATESADALALRIGRQIAIDAREAPLPTRIIWPIAHRPATFTVIARVLWLLGLARAEEDKHAVRLRARNLTHQLCTLSRDLGHVALIGHGYTNIFLRQNLKSSGWRSLSSRAHGYWSSWHFEKQDSGGRPHEVILQ